MVNTAAKCVTVTQQDVLIGTVAKTSRERSEVRLRDFGDGHWFRRWLLPADQGSRQESHFDNEFWIASRAIVFRPVHIAYLKRLFHEARAVCVDQEVR
jgi:hypothetical protein